MPAFEDVIGYVQSKEALDDGSGQESGRQNSSLPPCEAEPTCCGFKDVA